VIYRATLQVARELTLNMLRTGYSTIIKESQDFTSRCSTRRVAWWRRAFQQPLHIGPISAQVGESPQALCRPHGAGRCLHRQPSLPGVQNHATDITIVTPVFVGERPHRLHRKHLRTSRTSAARCRAPTAATPPTCSRKGLLIPPLKILAARELTLSLQEMICANTRTPEVTVGRHPGAGEHERIWRAEVCELFGKVRQRSRVLACWSRWMEILRERAAPRICQGAGRTLWAGDRLPRRRRASICQATPHPATLEVNGDTLHFILDSDAQARGPINLRPCVSRNFIECLVKMIFIPACR
jgi:N-methylhydantoinase B